MYLDREFPIKVHKLVNLTSVLDLKRAPCVGNLPIFSLAQIEDLGLLIMAKF